jgi:hypothetical protein
MYLVGEELCRRPLLHLCQLPSASKNQVRAAYASLAAAMPNDPAAPRFLAMVDQSLGLAAEPAERFQAVIAGARSVVRAVVDAARKNRALSEKTAAAAEGQASRDGDELTEYYVRQAAAAARQLSPDVAPRALLLGLGVALDDSSLLVDAPVVGRYWQQVESGTERATRLAALGNPTMRARHDWAQHFAVSAALVVLVGSQGAEGAGILKELSDSRGGSGFSFADLSADLAGIQFAEAVGGGKILLSRIEGDFLVRDFLPAADGLREGVAWQEFVKSYGYPPNSRLGQELEALRKRILALPAYR